MIKHHDGITLTFTCTPVDNPKMIANIFNTYLKSHYYRDDTNWDEILYNVKTDGKYNIYVTLENTFEAWYHEIRHELDAIIFTINELRSVKT